MPENHDARNSPTPKILHYKSTTGIFLIIEEIRRRDRDRVIVHCTNIFITYNFLLQKKLHLKTLYDLLTTSFTIIHASYFIYIYYFFGGGMGWGC